MALISEICLLESTLKYCRILVAFGCPFWGNFYVYVIFGNVFVMSLGDYEEYI